MTPPARDPPDPYASTGAAPSPSPIRSPLTSPLFILAVVLGLFTLLDVGGFTGLASSGPPAAAAAAGSSPKEVPPPKYATMMAGPTIRFLYCYSWGYRKVFEQYAGILQQKYPQLSIEGDNFPPPSWRLQLAQLIGLAKMALIICVVGGINPFPFVGTGVTPTWYDWLISNKLYAGLMIFFLCNAVETQLISTGAFEIRLDNLPVWSKIESGRIPQPPELFQIIENHFKMNVRANSGTIGEGMPSGSFRDEL